MTSLNSNENFRWGFGSKENLRPDLGEDFLSRWENQRPQWKQVHGTRCVWIDQPKQDAGNCDGLLTDQPLLPLGIVTADCCPILLMHEAPPRRIASALHAGWRGTFEDIIGAWWQTLSKRTPTRPENWKAILGPTIGGCCYEISLELMNQFHTRFAHLTPSNWSEGRFLNLHGLLKNRLNELGIEKVDFIKTCTFCGKNADSSKYLYESFRRDRATQRQYSVIEVAADTVL